MTDDVGNSRVRKPDWLLGRWRLVHAAPVIGFLFPDGPAVLLREQDVERGWSPSSRGNSCRVRQLWPFLDGALPDAMQARVVVHLEGCVNCRSHFDYEREFLAAVCDAGAAGDFEPLRVRVLSALADQGFITS